MEGGKWRADIGGGQVKCGDLQVIGVKLAGSGGGAAAQREPGLPSGGAARGKLKGPDNCGGRGW